MKTRIRFIRNLTMFWVAVSFFVQRPAFAQEDFEVTLARYKSTPAVFELAKMTRSYDPTVAVAAIRSLKEFTKVNSGRISNDALEVYEELEQKAKNWVKKYTHDSAPGTVTMVKLDVDYQELIQLHLVQPKELAFIDTNGFTDYDLRSLNELDSLENLTIQNCRFFEGRQLEKIRLPNLKILHLNGSGLINVTQITLKSFPKLKYLNLKNTKVSKSEVSYLRKTLGEGVKIVFE